STPEKRADQAEAGKPPPPAGTETIEAGSAPVSETSTALVLARVATPTPVTLPDGRVAALERLPAQPAGPRVQVADQCERVLWAHRHWLDEQRNVVRDLEEFGLRLADQERALQARAHAVEEAECVARQHQNAAEHLRNHLEGWQSRLSAREIA